MEIFLDKRAVKQIRVSAQDAVDEGDSDTLREDIVEAFNDEQIEEIERRVDAVDFNDFIAEILDEWSGDEVDELFELLEGHLAEAGIDVKYAPKAEGDDDDDDDDDEEEEEDDDEEVKDDDTTSLPTDDDDEL